MFSDGWKGYSNDDSYFAAHARVNHSKEFVNYKQIVKIDGPVPNDVHVNGKKHYCHIQNIESTWGRARKFFNLHKGAHPE